MYIIKDNALTVAAFIALSKSAGWDIPTEEQVAVTLQNSLFTVAAMHDGEIIGMGRLVGDGALKWYIQDVIVSPEHQSKGVGRAIVQRLLDHIKANTLPNTKTSIGLNSAKGKEGFYAKFGFQTRPESAGAGMVLAVTTSNPPL